MKWKLTFLIYLVLTSVTLGDTMQHGKNIPAKGFVPDAETAVKIAEAVLTPIYGASQVQSERPFTARLRGGIWLVVGHLPDGADGGVAEVRISKHTGEILGVRHGK
jgi:hypothetical protein